MQVASRARHVELKALHLALGDPDGPAVEVNESRVVLDDVRDLAVAVLELEDLAGGWRVHVRPRRLDLDVAVLVGGVSDLAPPAEVDVEVDDVDDLHRFRLFPA